MSQDELAGAPTVAEPAPMLDVSEMFRLESSNSIWLFDAERMRFRRVPRDADPSSPSVAADWQPYFGLDIDPDAGAFTVALNEDGTRRLRAVRVDDPVRDDRTAELTLRPNTEPV